MSALTRGTRWYAGATVLRESKKKTNAAPITAMTKEKWRLARIVAPVVARLGTDDFFEFFWSAET